MKNCVPPEKEGERVVVICGENKNAQLDQFSGEEYLLRGCK
jgi:hypothetical protein